jgi:hypothetical protein
MSIPAFAILLATSVGLFVLPRRWAPLPLLAGACYIPIAQAIAIGPFNFYGLRLLFAVGIFRVLIRNERPAGGADPLDRWVLAWAAVALATSLLHENSSAVLVNRLGLVYTSCGAYFLLRTFCQSLDDAVRSCRITAVLLIPVASAMLFEAATGHNVFSSIGGVNELSEVRNGRVRAQGAFAHSILAGTVGAACLPLMLALWDSRRKTALAGALACCTMVITSGSSGPAMSALIAIGALCLWPCRNWMNVGRWLVVAGYVALDVVMNAPAYYILTRIDLTGSSTSWHRAALIETALAHITEWWLFGTDRTRHWMAYGVGWSGEQIDITNYYLRMGIDGGLPLMIAFIVVLAKGFSMVGQEWRHLDRHNPAQRFIPWIFGASLFAHASAFISVSYFDQSVVFLYLTLALIASSLADRAITTEPVPSPEPDSQRFSSQRWRSSQTFDQP